MSRKFYKDNDGEVYEYESDGSQDHLIGDKVAMTAAEIEAHINPPKTLNEVKAIKLSTIKTYYENAVRTMTGNTDPAEMASWTKQEQEARAWIADNTAITPIIDNLIIGRDMGESKADLVAKIIAKADAYAVAYAQVLGAYHAKQKAIEVATTVEEVEAI